ncbi:MAG: AAA family ATPase [Rhizobiaceae bacterium]
MIVEDQAPAIEFLSDPSSHGSADVHRIETHISEIFLAGDRAYKLKRAVKLPYVDFSSPQLRLKTCENEVMLNHETAPGLYLGVRRITLDDDGRLMFNGRGKLIDAVVEMARFDQDALFDKLAVDHRLTPDIMDRLAQEIAGFHDKAPVVRETSGSRNIENVLAINAAGFATSHVFSTREVADLNRRFARRLESFRDRLDTREADGKLRRCHGDLHLRNICMIDDEPVLFDCIEFNDAIATSDILYDLAFLLMDLWHRDLGELANRVANRYFDQTDNDNGYVLLPFFMAVRAAVRAHVIATQAEDDAAHHAELAATARTYFDLAQTLLAEDHGRLIAIGGFSGSGKSTVADALAPLIGLPPGARRLENDRLRKALLGTSADQRLRPEAYSEETTRRTYEELVRRSVRIAADGAAVIVDATFTDPAYRDAIFSAARETCVPFTGVWLEADPEVLRNRVAKRRSGPSDATVAVLDRQLNLELGQMNWAKIDTNCPVDRVAGWIRQTHFNM